MNHSGAQTLTGVREFANGCLTQQRLHYADLRRRVLLNSNLATAVLVNANLLGADFGLDLAFRPLRSAVDRVAVSPNGHCIASSHSDGSVWISEAETGQPIRSFGEHLPPVLGLAFSPDGSCVATSGREPVIQIWDVASGSEICVMTDGLSFNNVLTYSTDGRILVSARMYDQVTLWEPSTGTSLKTIYLDQEVLNSAAFSQDETQLLCGSPQGKVIYFDLHTGKTVKEFKSTAKQCRFTALSADGSLLAVSGVHTAISILAVGTRKLLRQLKGHTAVVNTACFSSDKTLLVSGGEDCCIRVWQVETGVCLEVLQAHNSAVSMVCFAPNDAFIVAAGKDGRIVRFIPKEKVSTASSTYQAITAVCLSSDCKKVATGHESGQILIWKTKTGQVSKFMYGLKREVKTLVFSTQTNLLGSVLSNNALHLWDVAEAEKLNFNELCDDNKLFALSPSGKYVAIASAGIDVWDVARERLTAELQPESGEVITLNYSPDGKLLYSGLSTFEIVAWNVNTGEISQTIEGVCAFGCSANGKVLAGLNQASMLTLYESVSGTELKHFPVSDMDVTKICVSNDGRKVAVNYHSLVLACLRMNKEPRYTELDHLWKADFQFSQAGQLHLVFATLLSTHLVIA